MLVFMNPDEPRRMQCMSYSNSSSENGLTIADRMSTVNGSGSYRAPDRTRHDHADGYLLCSTCYVPMSSVVFPLQCPSHFEGGYEHRVLLL